MRVWLVNPFDNLPTEGNRPQRYWLMARAFAAAGHEVTLWTSDFSHATKERRRIVSEANEGFAVRMIPTLVYPTNVCWARVRSHRRLAADFEAAALGQSVAGRPDLVIASTPPLGLCAAAMRVARACGARFVCDVQDAWPETFERLLPGFARWAGGILFAPMRRVARRLYREADLVSGVCRRYAELTGRPDYLLAYLGIEGGETRPRVRTTFRRLVYAGNLGDGYDLDTVLDAVKAREDLSIDIAGLGPRFDGLVARVDALGIADRVRFHGYLGAEELKKLFAECDVGVIPMRDDSWVGLPNKLTDYLSAGLQVVSSLHGECGEVLAETGFGQVYDFGSVGSLLTALGALREAEVGLPERLRAESIYPRYAREAAKFGIIPEK